MFVNFNKPYYLFFMHLSTLFVKGFECQNITPNRATALPAIGPRYYLIWAKTVTQILPR